MHLQVIREHTGAARGQTNISRYLMVALFVVAFWRNAADAATGVFVWGGYGSETSVPTNLSKVIAIAGGSYHYLAHRSDDTLMAWGINYYGEANPPADATNIVAASAGEKYSLALRPNGTVRLFGSIPNYGTNVPADATNFVTLGVGPGSQHPIGLRPDGTFLTWGGSYYPATNVSPSVTNAVAVAAGGGFQAVLRGDGTVSVWGDNSGSQTNIPSSATNLVAISAGYNHVAGLRADGTLVVWGMLSFVGNVNINITNIIPTSGATGIVEVASGANHILALRRDGRIVTFGVNDAGALNVPAAATNIGAVAGTVYSSAAVVGWGPPIITTPLVNRSVVSAGTAYLRVGVFGAGPFSFQWKMFGTNLPGATNSILIISGLQPSQVGLYSVTVSNSLGGAVSRECSLGMIPLEINSQPRSQEAYVGQQVTLNVIASGQGVQYQWRFNGTTIPGATNSLLVLTNVQVSDGGVYSVFVSNPYGSLGSTDAALIVTPILITQQPQDLVTFLHSTASLGIAAQANAPISYQWRFNGIDIAGATTSSLTVSNVQYSRTGDYDVRLAIPGSTTNSRTSMLYVGPIAAWGGKFNGFPKTPSGLTNISAIAAGHSGALALRSNGTVVAWGSSASLTNLPPDLTNVVMIACGAVHNVALKSNGTVVAWGASYYNNTNPPIELTNAMAIYSGSSSYYSFAIRSDGTIVGWGDNSFGQTDVPTGLSNVVAVACGYEHSLALKADGTVVAWGSNSYGQTNAPAGLVNVVAIAAGDFHSIALKADGQTVFWGSSNWNPLPPNTSNYLAVAAGYEYSIGLRMDGTVAGGGYPYYGATAPPTELINAVSIAGGEFYALALVGNSPPPIYTLLANPSWTTSGFSLSFPTLHGKVYGVEYKNSLLEANWSRFPLILGNGGTRTFTDPLAAPGQRYYRVRQW